MTGGPLSHGQPTRSHHLKCAMRIKTLLLVALLSAAFGVQAQSTPAKKELAARIVKLQMPGIEGLARNLAEQPAAALLERAGQILQARVPPDRQEAVGKEIQADVKKYVDEAVPIVRDRAAKLAPTTVGAVLEEKFTEDELRQVISVMENPAWLKFQQLGPDMQKPLMEKLIADSRAQIEPKIKALEQSIAKTPGHPGRRRCGRELGRTGRGQRGQPGWTVQGQQTAGDEVSRQLPGRFVHGPSDQEGMLHSGMPFFILGGWSLPKMPTGLSDSSIEPHVPPLAEA
jgi:hypothetical protein